MLTLNGKEYYTAPDLVKYLNMKYPSVIALLAKYNAPKYKNKYIVDEELAKKLKERENRTAKLYDLSDKFTFNQLIDNLKGR